MGNKTSRLVIPKGVITDHVLPYLELCDLRRLRRVGKVIKHLVDEYIRENVRSSSSSPPLVISHEDCWTSDGCDNDMGPPIHRWLSMSTLLQAEVHAPATSFFFMYAVCEDVEFGAVTENWNIPRFLEEYGSQVTRLRISSLSAPMNSKMENQFYESLPNLIHLEVDYLIYRETIGGADKKKKGPFFPNTFRNLESLTVMHYNDKSACPASLVWFGKLIDVCVNLEVLQLPWYNSGSRTSFRFAFYVLPYLRSRLEARRQYQGGDQGSLQRLQGLGLVKLMMGMDDALVATFLFSTLCLELVSCGVKLLNAPAYYIGALGIMPEQGQRETIEALNRCVVSLHGLNGQWFKAELPNLNELRICTTNDGCILPASAEPHSWEAMGPPVWPSLKILSVTVDSKKLEDGNDVKETFFRSVLFGVQRPSVVELNLVFIAKENVSAPSSSWIRLSCFNLRKLSLTSWIGTNTAIVKLWEGLPLLEEVCLDGCLKLANAAFIGNDTTKPVFLQLKELKKLSLRNIDKMRRITDTAFFFVFRHLKVREFELTCSDRTATLTSITRQGIRTLLSGEFAESIQRFDFRDWRLADLNEEEFAKLRDRFRSAHLT